MLQSMGWQRVRHNLESEQQQPLTQHLSLNTGFLNDEQPDVSDNNEAEISHQGEQSQKVSQPIFPGLFSCAQCQPLAKKACLFL